MNLKGKTIVFLGDSITGGGGASEHSKCYVERIAAEYGVDCRNFGRGGTRIAVQTRPSADPRHDMDFISRVDELPSDADLVFVYGGINDFGSGDAPLGVMTDRIPTTFCGAMHTLCLKLLEKYDADKVVFATPIHCRNDDNPYGYGNKAVPGVTLADYVRIIKEVACYYALPVLDLYATSGIQPSVPFLREKYTADGLHPNDAGHALLSKKIAAFLNSCI